MCAEKGPAVGQAHGGESSEQDAGKIGADGAGEGFSEEGNGGWGALLGEEEGGFFGEVVFGPEEGGGPGSGAGAFESENAGDAGGEEFGLVGAEFGTEAEEKWGGVEVSLET